MFHQTDYLVKFLFIFLLTVSPSFFYTMLLLGGDNHLSHYYFLVTVLCLFVA